MTDKWKTLLLTTAFSTTLLAPAAVYAQDADEEVEEIIVSGIRASLDSAAAIKRNADQMVDAISAEDIGMFSDNNIGEALQRIPGVLLERDAGEGFRISIRGLGPRFVRTTVNGRTALSTAGGEDGNSEDSRGFTLNMIPSEVITRVTVEKSTQAKNLEGGIGGTLDMQTNRPIDFANKRDEDFYVSGAFRGSYNDLVDKFSPRGSIFVNKRVSETFGAFLGVVIDDTDRIDHALETASLRVRNLRIDDLSPGVLLNGTAMTQDDINALHDSSQNVGPNGEDAHYSMPSSARNTARTLDRARQTFTAGLQFQPNENLDINFDWTYGHEKNNQLLQRALYSPQSTLRGDEDKVTSLTIDFDDQDFSRADPTMGTVTAFEFTGVRGDERANATNRYIPREQDIHVGGLNLDWSNDVWTLNADIGYAEQKTVRYDNYTRNTMNADRDRRDLRFETMDGGFDSVGEDGYPVAYYVGYDAAGNATPFDPADLGMYFWDSAQRTLTNEAADDVSARFDITRAFDNDGLLDSIIAGVAWNKRNGIRTRARAQEDDDDDYIISLEEDDPTDGLEESLVSNYLPGIDGIVHDFVFLSTFDPIYDPLFNLTEDELPAEPSQGYNVTEEVTAGYVQAAFSGEGNLPFRGNVGVRVVHTNQSGSASERVRILSDDGLSEDRVYLLRETERSYTDVLPSFNLAFDVREDLVFRISGNKALTRPDPKDLTSYLDLNRYESDDDEAIGSGSGGNPNLEPYRTLSLDGSLEWYPEAGGSYALGVFYKKIDGWIATGRSEEAFTQAVGVDGGDNGEFDEDDITDGIAGNGGDYFEVREELYDIRRKVNTDGGSIQGFEFAFHQPFDSFTDGPLQYFGLNGSLTYVDAKIEAVVPDTLLPISLRGTSKWSGNMVGYFEKGKFSARVAYNYRSDFLFQEAEDTDRSAEWTKGSSVIDVNFGYKINKNVSVRLSANNLTGVTRQRYWQTAGTNKFSDLRDNGQSFSIDLRFKM